ncbi:MAG: CAP domain-containing protein [Thermoanaerobaculia bacterium]
MRSQTASIVALAAVAFVTFLPASSGADLDNVCVEPTRPAVAPATSVVEVHDVLAELNLRRMTQGLTPLVLNAKLNQAAADRAADLFRKHYFDHVSPDGVSPFVAFVGRGYIYAVAGENLAVGQKSARQVVDDWMASPGHRANILATDYQDAGLAIVPGSPTGRTRGFTFVSLFGTEREDRVLIAKGAKSDARSSGLRR